MSECSEPDCARQAERRGMCDKHYRRRLRGGEYGHDHCEVPGCTGFGTDHGLCVPHRQRQRKYGLSIEDLVLVDSRAACDTCLAPPAVVDHDHETGRVRGVLCRDCNLALGHAHDDPDRLRRLATYLETT